MFQFFSNFPLAYFLLVGSLLQFNAYPDPQIKSESSNIYITINIWIWIIKLKKMQSLNQIKGEGGQIQVSYSKSGSRHPLQNLDPGILTKIWIRASYTKSGSGHPIQNLDLNNISKKRREKKIHLCQHHKKLFYFILMVFASLCP